jgi:hypothetical protein
MTEFNHKPFIEQLALRQTGENEFEMVNPLDIAYGGYAIAVTCKTAALTVLDLLHAWQLLLK